MADEPKKIKFYTDTHIAKAVAVQLRNRGVDIVRCEEVRLAEASDLEHLEYALKHDRVVITNDDDFLATIKGWQSQGRNHVGMMYCLPHVQGTGAIGKIVNLCFELHELIEGGAGTVEEDIVNHVIYVS